MNVRMGGVVMNVMGVVVKFAGRQRGGTMLSDICLCSSMEERHLGKVENADRNRA